MHLDEMISCFAEGILVIMSLGSLIYIFVLLLSLFLTFLN